MSCQLSREHAPDQQRCNLLPHPPTQGAASNVSIQVAAAVDHRAHEQIQQRWSGSWMRAPASSPLHRTRPSLPRAEGPAPRSASSRDACDSVGADLSLAGKHGPGDSPEPSLRRSSRQPDIAVASWPRSHAAQWLIGFDTFRSGTSTPDGRPTDRRVGQIRRAQ